MQHSFFLNTLYHYYLTVNAFNKKYDKVLDFGCGKGDFIGNIKVDAKELYGFDVDHEKIRQAKEKYPVVLFKSIRVGEKLPYKDNFFDAVFMFHILEHVDSEKKALKEVYRVLKKGGEVFVASPYKGLYSFADAANLRYKVPNLHRWIIESFQGKEAYKRKFTDSKIRYLFGDSSINRKWHKHYDKREIEKLLRKDFSILEFKRYGLFQPFLLVLYNFYLFMFKKESIIIKWLIWLDNNLNTGNFAYFFFLKAVKKTR